jgi:hypothetical protein
MNTTVCLATAELSVRACETVIASVTMADVPPVQVGVTVALAVHSIIIIDCLCNCDAFVEHPNTEWAVHAALTALTRPANDCALRVAAAMLPASLKQITAFLQFGQAAFAIPDVERAAVLPIPAGSCQRELIMRRIRICASNLGSLALLAVLTAFAEANPKKIWACERVVDAMKKPFNKCPI